MTHNFRLHTPIGTNDILPEDAEMKRNIIRKIENVFEGYGYRVVESPMFEYIEVFSDEKMGSISPEEMFRFIDKDGAVIALRSDMTPSIARIAATTYTDEAFPLRLCYYGNAFRDPKSYQGKKSEFCQAGIELLGCDSVEADAEAITVSIKSLIECGIKDFKLNIGQVKFFNAILDESDLDTRDKNSLKELIASRNYAGVEEFIKDKVISENSRKFFMNLTKLVGEKDTLNYARSITESKEALEALDELEKLYDLLSLHGVGKYVSFDLGMVNKLNYYTGIIFRGYTYGTGFSIIDGGRYNNLVKQFGYDMPAVGFALKVDEIITVLIKNKVKFESTFARAMVASTKEGAASAIKIADIYRKGGVKVESSLCGYTLDENIEYMKAKGIESLIFMKDVKNITYVRNDAENGILTSEITVKDLVFPHKEIKR